MINIKPGVQFTFDPGGIQILNALKSISRQINHDLTITSGSDGDHPVEPNVHKLGQAYDVRSKDLDTVMKQQVLANLNNLLSQSRFYFFLENPGLDTEHFHIQVKNGTKFTIQDFLNS